MKDLKRHFLKTFIIGAILLTGIVILLNMVFDNINPGRFDLTAGNVYKLSPSVKKILSDLDAPIEVTYYVSSSEKMPTKWKNLERDVIDKLEEIKLASNGRLNYTVFDPSAEEEREAYEEQKESDEESDDSSMLGEKSRKTISRKKIAERLFEKGVIPFGVQSTERDEFAVKRIYSSLVLSYLDRKEDVIPEVRPELFGSLEYEIMSRIYKLISNKRPKIAIYPSQPEIPPQYRRQMMQQPPDMYTEAEQLLKNSGYDVTRTNIKKDDPIPDDIQTMIIFIDQPLNDRQKFEIDRMLHNGVNIIMAAQNYNFQIMPSRGGTPGTFDVQAMPARLNINPMFRNYGFEIDDKVFMDRSSAYIQVPVYQTRNMGFFQIQEQRYEPVTKPVIIKVNAENINNEISISNKISELFYLYGSKINVMDEIVEKDTLSVTTLFTSSSNSWTRESFGYRPVDTTEPAKEDMLKNQPLGILVEGTFSSVYRDQDVPEWPADPGEENQGAATDDSAEKIEGKAKPAKMIVFGGSNLFKNDVIKSVMSHKALLMNSVDALTLGDELINIRSKNIVARRIKETSSVGKAVSKAFVVWFPPLIFILIGIYITIRRKLR